MTPPRFLAGGYGGSTEQTLALCVLRADDRIEVLDTVSGLHDASWSDVDGGRCHAYVAVESVSGGQPVGAGQVAVVRLSGTTLEVVRLVSSGGVQPCHLELSADGSLLAVAHYGDGVVTLHRASCGREAGVRQVAAHELGAGHRAHAVRWIDPDHLLVTDLAGDRVDVLRFDRSSRLTRVSSVALPEGSGPRHVAVRGDHAYVSLENDPGVATLWLGGGRAPRLLDVLRFPGSPAAPAHASAARLSHDGLRLLVLSRGTDLLHVVDVGDDATPVLTDSVPTGGVCPYDAWSLPGRIVIAHERSRDLVTLPEVGSAGGAGYGRPTGRTRLPFGVAHLTPC